jgi:small-conductance mechanosensitive channel
VGSRGILALTAADIDAGPDGTGATVETTARQMADRLRSVLADAVQARSWRVVLRGSAEAAVGLMVAGLLIVVIARGHRAISGRLKQLAERKVTQSGIIDVSTLRASRLVDVAGRFVTGLSWLLHAVVLYAAVGFVLRRFAYTRPWGTSMRGFLVGTLEDLALGVTGAVPGLITVAIIAIVARFLTRLVALWFDAIERGSLKPRWIYPETALPTRRLLTGLVWIFAIVVAYPYLPGSQTDAFKGVSVLLGLMVTLGSSGLVNHVMSGLMITYSRALRVGDFVRIGDVEGTVIHLGVLSVKVRTVPNEEVTIPNAVVVAQTTVDYSRPGDASGVFIPTSVTIGYDTPWRQVHALLLMAAERTDGVRRKPKPYVLQAGLEDFYVKYTLFVCLERQEQRPFVLDRLHAHVQDLFNEYGVQIMSPNYVIDPAAPKVVAKGQWYAAPAPPETAPTAEPTRPRST